MQRLALIALAFLSFSRNSRAEEQPVAGRASCEMELASGAVEKFSFDLRNEIELVTSEDAGAGFHGGYKVVYISKTTGIPEEREDGTGYDVKEWRYSTSLWLVKDGKENAADVAGEAATISLEPRDFPEVKRLTCSASLARY